MCRINFTYIFSFSFGHNCYIYCLNFSIFYLITWKIRATNALLLFSLTNMKWKMLLTCLTSYFKHISYWYRNIKTQWTVEPNQFFWGERALSSSFKVILKTVALIVPRWALFISNVFICFNDIFMLFIYLSIHRSIHPSIHQSIVTGSNPYKANFL